MRAGNTEEGSEEEERRGGREEKVRVSNSERKGYPGRCWAEER